MLFTWFILAGFILLLAPENLTNRFQFAFARIFRWPLSVGRNIYLSARIQQPVKQWVSRREYNKLQNHLANLTAWLIEEHKKVEKLSKLRDRFALEGAGFVLADVITASADGGELIINRGKEDGLVKGQFVLGDNSVIGTISEVGWRTARVRLVTSPDSKIAVTIAGLNVNRLMQGSSDNSAKIKLLQIKHKVKEGAAIYVCKKPGFLDVPVIVGVVTECKRDIENPSLWDITVKPVCDIEGLNSVAVIVMNPQ